MKYIFPEPIMHFVELERARCVKLVKALARGADKDFLAYCIEYSVTDKEIEQFRQRFNELKPPTTAADIEELM